MKFYLRFFILFIVLYFLSCTDSDNYLSDGLSEKIEVKIKLAYSLDENDTTKITAILPGDSVFFLSDIYPSKSIRNKKYFWTLNDSIIANEFSFKSAINTPGIHKIGFNFVDVFGDTLKDSLTLAVASYAKILNGSTVPTSKTQYISPNEPLTFAWASDDPDSLWHLNYKFFIYTIQKDKIINILDTLLNKPYFVYNKSLNPLTKYFWEVQVKNEIYDYYSTPLCSFFYTKGESLENALLLNFNRTKIQHDINLKVTITSKDSLFSKSYVFTKDHGERYISPLKDGDYFVKMEAENFPDYKEKAIEVSVQNGVVLELDSLYLKDETPPLIQGIFGDTLEIADTLKVIVKDGGGAVSLDYIFVKFGNTTLSKHSEPKITQNGDTIFIPYNGQEKNWTYKIFSVEARDFCANKTIKNFYLKPNSLLSEAFGD